MAVSAITNILRVNNNAATERQLALRVYAGEVTRAFRRGNIMAALHASRDMRYGRSMQFPAMGRLEATFHVKGNNILIEGSTGKQLQTVERLVHVDDMLVTNTFIPQVDEMLSHYDGRAPAADECGESLAFFYDGLAIRQTVRAARTNGSTEATFIPSDMVTDGTGVGSYVQSAFNTEALIIAALESSAQAMDERYIPDDNRHAPLAPAHYWDLINNDKTISIDYSRDGQDFARGKMYYAAGFLLHKTNHIPSDYWVDPDTGTPATGNLATPTGAYNLYGGDMTTLHTVVFHRTAIATVWLMDVTLESEYLIEYIGTPVLAKMMAGTGRLRPEAAVEIGSTTSQPTLDPTT